VSSPKLRFGWLDALVLAVVFGLIGYVVYRAQSHFHYDWDWRLIPGYFIRYDAEQGDWVLNLLGQGFLATVRLALWGGVLAALIGGAMGVCRVTHVLFFRLLGWSYVGLIRNIPPLVFIFIFYFFISGQLLPACWMWRTGSPKPRRRPCGCWPGCSGRRSCCRISCPG
jgi:polar amino acid transport system permease protein